jgi:transcriptional regulator with AAA-type ATPase domain
MNSHGCETVRTSLDIIKKFRETRASAREIIRLLSRNFNLSVIIFRFSNLKTGYKWKEELINTSAVSSSKKINFRMELEYFEIIWKISGELSDNQELLTSILEILTNNLVYFKFPTRRTNIRNLNPSLISVSPASKKLLENIDYWSKTVKALLLIGENGSGKQYVAELVHNNSPAALNSFYTYKSRTDLKIHPGETGTMYIPDWSNQDEQELQDIFRFSLNNELRIIASCPEPVISGKAINKWRKLTEKTGIYGFIPPLRERIEDIPLLAGIFLEQMSKMNNYPAPDISPDALDALRSYKWPGNAEELKNVMFTLLLRENFNTIITYNDLPPFIKGSLTNSATKEITINSIEKDLLTNELIKQNGNMTKTALKLGLTPRQIYWRVKKYKLNPSEFKKNH